MSGGWIQTFSGRKFYPASPSPDDVCLDDIAVSLSRQARFNGHTESFYSVAQHCVLVSRIVPKDLAKGALFHDAAEAYLGDLPTPIKSMVPEFVPIEAGVMAAIGLALDFDPALAREIKAADIRLLATEKRDLMTRHAVPWPALDGIEPYAHGILPVNEHMALSMFMARAWEIENPESAPLELPLRGRGNHELPRCLTCWSHLARAAPYDPLCRDCLPLRSRHTYETTKPMTKSSGATVAKAAAP